MRPLFSENPCGLSSFSYLPGDNVAAPAVGLGTHIVVTAITKLFFVAVTLQTCSRQIDLVDLPAFCYIAPIPLPYSLIAPGHKQFHMVGPHKFRILNATFFRHSRNCRCLETQHRRQIAFSPTVPEGYCDSRSQRRQYRR